MLEHNKEHVDSAMMIMQANLDDMNPEYTPYITQKLLDAGANDVYWVPIIMKKGRPGLMLNVLADHSLLSNLEDVIFSETTTLGIRHWPVSCHRLSRKKVPVETPWGVVEMKVGYYEGELKQYSPEFQQCEKIAKQNGVPIKRIYAEARFNFEAMLREHPDLKNEH